MEMHLFSTPGPGMDITWVLDACRAVLGEKRDATLAFLPQASLAADRWLKHTERAFKGMARIEMIDTEVMQPADMESVLRRAAAVYIPGGNTYLLNHRLHTSGLAPYLRKKIQNGLPLVAFSAGAVVCGPNVLTSNDLNSVATTHFGALNVAPFNFNVHYDDQARRDEWLSEYHQFHDNPILMLADGAYVKVDGKSTTLVRGDAWCWRPGKLKERLTAGELIKPI